MEESLHLLLRFVLIWALYDSSGSCDISVSETPHAYKLSPDLNCKRLSTVDTPSTNDAIVTYLSSNNIKSAWLPIRKLDITYWQWINGEKYARVLGDPEHIVQGKDCGKLALSTKIIKDEYCSRKLPQYICEKQEPCNFTDSASLCFQYNNRSYTIYKESVTWYDAVGGCSRRNASLAVLSASSRAHLLQELHSLVGTAGQTWLGLRSKEYRMGHSLNENIKQYYWGAWPVCPCPDTHCVIMKRYYDGRYMWSPENCSARHHELCQVPCKPDQNAVPVPVPTLADLGTVTEVEFTNWTTSSANITKTIITSDSNGGLIAAIVVPILIIIILIVCILLWYCCFRKTKDERLLHYRNALTNFTSLQRNQKLNDTSMQKKLVNPDLSRVSVDTADGGNTVNINTININTSVNRTDRQQASSVTTANVVNETTNATENVRIEPTTREQFDLKDTEDAEPDERDPLISNQNSSDKQDVKCIVNQPDNGSTKSVETPPSTMKEENQPKISVNPSNPKTKNKTRKQVEDVSKIGESSNDEPESNHIIADVHIIDENSKSEPIPNEINPNISSQSHNMPVVPDVESTNNSIIDVKDTVDGTIAEHNEPHANDNVEIRESLETPSARKYSVLSDSSDVPESNLQGSKPMSASRESLNARFNKQLAKIDLMKPPDVSKNEEQTFREMLQEKKKLSASGLRWLLWNLAETLVKHEERTAGEKGRKEGYTNFFKNGLHLTPEQIESIKHAPGTPQYVIEGIKLNREGRWVKFWKELQLLIRTTQRLGLDRWVQDIRKDIVHGHIRDEKGKLKYDNTKQEPLTGARKK